VFKVFLGGVMHQADYGAFPIDSDYTGAYKNQEIFVRKSLFVNICVFRLNGQGMLDFLYGQGLDSDGYPRQDLFGKISIFFALAPNPLQNFIISTIQSGW
jgi:hypothetical protein